MAKVTIKIKKEVEQEIEKEVPAYYEHGWQFYNILSPNSYISVFDCAYHETGIRIESDSEFMVRTILEGGKEISKENFQEALMKALNHINYMVFMETAEPIADAIYERNNQLQTSLNSL